MKSIGYFFVVATSCIMYSCYYDNEAELYPDSENCDTINITYNNYLAPLFQNHCNACHSNQNAAWLGGNIRLADYGQVKNAALNGSLVGSVSNSNGFSPMPTDYLLDNCAVLKIKKWVNEGMPEN